MKSLQLNIMSAAFKRDYSGPQDALSHSFTSDVKDYVLVISRQETRSKAEKEMRHILSL